MKKTIGRLWANFKNQRKWFVRKQVSQKPAITTWATSAYVYSLHFQLLACSRPFKLSRNCVLRTALLACLFFCCFSPLVVSFTLFALRCFLFVVGGSCVEAPFFFVRCLSRPSLLVLSFFRCQIITSLNLLLSNICSLYINTCCSFVQNSMLTLVAARCA